MARVLDDESGRLTDWEVAEVPERDLDGPAALAARSLRWLPARVPGTAADALRAAGLWKLGQPRAFDDADYWFRCRFRGEAGGAQALRLDGLATVADVWLNGQHLLRSESMYQPARLDVSSLIGAENELLIRFSALGPLLEAKRPRPRWRPRLVAHQNLRWYRTTLLGRMPGWCPPVPPIGPVRPVVLERGLRPERLDVRTRVEDEAGVLSAEIAFPSAAPPPARASLVIGGTRLALERDGHVFRVTQRLPNVPLWWPHTHGAPRLYPLSLEVDAPGAPGRLSLGPVGFRTVELDDADDGFALRVNNQRIFCRGAVWTTPDLVRFWATEGDYRRALERARDAGMNMLRIGGTMSYEDAAFHALCDELGILVWQDLMFANFDYPTDEAFVAAATAEVAALADRLQTSPSLAIVCGNSEVEQQAAMLGLPRETWRSPLFGELLPAALRQVRPDVPYWPSSPAGGALPFQVSKGLGHYYGVGAYLRPLEDARRADVRFASECLAFANVPAPSTVEALLGPGETPPHHPRWKERVPRDPGVGWDFEDVRDHYVARLFAVEPLQIRYADPDRYLALGRVATGEVMAATFAEWRRRGSRCAGALVWTFNDVAPGAGWGVVDAHGRPKAAYHFLRRALAPFALFLIDEGVNGLHAHAVNDGPQPIDAELAVTFWRHGTEPVASCTRTLHLPPRTTIEVHIDELLPAFRDTTYAYRFGPPAHDAVTATLTDTTTTLPTARATYFPTSYPITPTDIGLTADAEPSDGALCLRLRTQRLAYAIAIDAPGFTPDDEYFTLAPGEERPIRLTPTGEKPGREILLQSLNMPTPLRLKVPS